jgi:hypothetical protein
VAHDLVGEPVSTSPDHAHKSPATRLGKSSQNGGQVVENTGISSSNSSLLPSRLPTRAGAEISAQGLGNAHLLFDLKDLALTSHEC